MLPSIYNHKNFIIVENENKEKEPVITSDNICKISKKQLENTKEGVKRGLESDKMFVERGAKNIIFIRGYANYKSSVKYVEKTLKYENICKTSKDIDEIKKIMNEIKKIKIRIIIKSGILQ